MNETVFQNLNWGETELARHGIETARLDAEVLLSHTIGASRIDLHLNKDRPLSANERQRFISSIKRRQKREPVAYITGRREFWSLDIEVNQSVLIPRPETEGIIEQAIRLYKGRTPDILDLCTGSGCVAAALATEFPASKITVSDISGDAIAVARRNLAFAGGGITFLTGDLFSALHQSPITDHRSRRFDLITANPPYIAEGDLKGLDCDIRRYEPREALLAGPDGLAISKRILKDAPEFLKEGGHLIIEIGIRQAASLKEFALNTCRYGTVAVVQDHSSIERYLVCGL